MSTIYLIDFENVNSKEKLNLATLDESDTVYFFYTDNCPKVPLDFFLGNKATLVFKKTPKGDQVLDKHLIGTLGYLVAKNGKEKRYVVVSADQGYKSCIDMWNAEEGVNISLKRWIGFEPPKTEIEYSLVDNREQIELFSDSSEIQSVSKKDKEEDVPVTPMVPQEPRKIVAKGAPAAQKAEVKPAEVKKEPSLVAVPTKSEGISNTELNNRICKEMQFVVGGQDIGKVAKIVIHCKKTGKTSLNVYRELIQKFGKKRGGQFYHSLKDKGLLDCFFAAEQC